MQRAGLASDTLRCWPGAGARMRAALALGQGKLGTMSNQTLPESAKKTKAAPTGKSQQARQARGRLYRRQTARVETPRWQAIDFWLGQAAFTSPEDENSDARVLDIHDCGDPCGCLGAGIFILLCQLRCSGSAYCYGEWADDSTKPLSKAELLPFTVSRRSVGCRAVRTYRCSAGGKFNRSNYTGCGNTGCEQPDPRAAKFASRV